MLIISRGRPPVPMQGASNAARLAPWVNRSENHRNQIESRNNKGAALPREAPLCFSIWAIIRYP